MLVGQSAAELWLQVSIESIAFVEYISLQEPIYPQETTSDKSNRSSIRIKIQLQSSSVNLNEYIVPGEFPAILLEPQYPARNKNTDFRYKRKPWFNINSGY